MVLTPSNMTELGSTAPDFELPDLQTGNTVGFDDVAGEKATVVIFMCNHCPFVLHIGKVLGDMAREFEAKGIAFVGINSNDEEAHPADAPELMPEFAEKFDIEFAYLHDDTQDVAKAYGAACTPDFFVYDGNKKLVYRGQLDASRPGNDTPVDGADLRAALDSILAGKEVSSDQKASMGCNVKWR
jgi:peroxiredoxin